MAGKIKRHKEYSDNVYEDHRDQDWAIRNKNEDVEG